MSTCWLNTWKKEEEEEKWKIYSWTQKKKEEIKEKRETQIENMRQIFCSLYRGAWILWETRSDIEECLSCLSPLCVTEAWKSSALSRPSVRPQNSALELTGGMKNFNYMFMSVLKNRRWDYQMRSGESLPPKHTENNKEASSEMISWFISSFSNVMWSLSALWNCVNCSLFCDVLWLVVVFVDNLQKIL